VRLPTGGVIGIQLPLLACLVVACGAVAPNSIAEAFGYGDQLLGKLAGVGHDPLDHGPPDGEHHSSGQSSSLRLVARADSGDLIRCVPAPMAVKLQLMQEGLREGSVANSRVLPVTSVGLLKPVTTQQTSKRSGGSGARQGVMGWRAALTQAEPTPT